MSAPDVFGSLTPLDVARQVARYALHRLDEVDPDFAADMRSMARAVGQDYWLDPPPEVDVDMLTRAQVAAEAGVTPAAVSLWTSRGISDNQGGRWYLPQTADGRYRRVDVDQFHRVRNGHTPTVALPAGEVCVCGHGPDEHDPDTGRCLATLPDPCSCHGLRTRRRKD